MGGAPSLFPTEEVEATRTDGVPSISIAGSPGAEAHAASMHLAKPAAQDGLRNHLFRSRLRSGGSVIHAPVLAAMLLTDAASATPDDETAAERR